MDKRYWRCFLTSQMQSYFKQQISEASLWPIFYDYKSVLQQISSHFQRHKLQMQIVYDIARFVQLNLFSVHTPDGAPCGLLNHLSMPVEIVTHPVDGSKIPQVSPRDGTMSIEPIQRTYEL